MCAEVRTGDAYDLLPRLAKRSIDLVITSPPYWGLRTYEGDHNWEILLEWESTDAKPGTVPGYA
ncbi:hypothetical protein tb265_26020 [Gemmatimonadetes bacterium T265]|nr:hypothetical protein tb265_26020 [Gemmatimonadetes bacterium T265]